MSERRLDLGFLSPCEPWKLESRFFPSKVGGLPAWLHLGAIPDLQRTRCPICENATLLLCQVYAPVEDDDDAFHRTVFVMACARPECHAEDAEAGGRPPFVVLRCQLPRRNEFYPYEPPVEKPSWRPDLTAGARCKLCSVCGVAADKHCAACKQEYYCSKDHQTSHWKAGHKQYCGKDSESNTKNFVTTLRWPESELDMEPAEDEDCPLDDLNESSDEESQEEHAHREMKKLREMERSGEAGSLTAVDMADHEEEESEDETFLRFKKIVSHTPDQVLRYWRGGKPLWISSEGIPAAESVPNCEVCSSPRVFEFQIMPQLVASLALDAGLGEASIDWGVLVVYTCAKSCNQAESPYKTEYIVRQNVAASKS